MLHVSKNNTTNTCLAICIYDPPSMWRARCLVCAVLLCTQAVEGQLPAAVEKVINPLGVIVDLILESQRAEVCVRNELAYETTYWNIEKARHDKIWKCKDCPRGTYGGEPGVCHPCPQFTRQLKYKKAGSTSDPGTLWCENRCEYLKDNNDQDSVTFLSANVDNLVLMRRFNQDFLASSIYNLCNTCAESTFKVTRSADVILKHYRHDLMDSERVGDPQKAPEALAAQTQRLRHFRFTLDDLANLAAIPHLEFFQWSICASCPRGFVIDPTLGNFPCRACLVTEGVANPADATWRKCAHCTAHQYQITESVTYEHNGRQTAVVGVLCTFCAPGSKRVSETPCRLPTECCEPCPLNHWKAENQGLCILVSPTYVPVIHQQRATQAFTQYVTSGATAQQQCQRGDILMFKWNTDILIYCEGEACADKMATNSWRTCVRCSVDETRHVNDAGACVPCANAQQKFVVDTQGQCQGCNACQELETKSSTDDISHLSTPTIQYPSGTGYKVNTITAKCVDLRRRQLQKKGNALEPIGFDFWRPPFEPQGKQLSDWHFVDRTNQCKETACDKKCSEFPFMYSNGCGERADTVLVRQGTNKPVNLKDLSPSSIDLSTWSVVTEGECKYCTFCARGSYNAGCNKGYGGVPGAQGQCSPCITQCEADHFLHHPDKDAGCHDPAETKKATDGSGQWMTKQTYECRLCPTWVHEHGKIYTVTACGLNTHYKHASLDGDIEVPAMLDGEQPFYESSPKRKTFRSFYNDKIAYCLPGFYFNSKLPDCNLLSKGQPFKLPAEYGTVDIGYADYNPGCCAVCKVCASPLEYKDISIWKACTGDTMEDTQNHCMDKCLINYWQNRTQKTCKRCSSCYDGIL